MASFVKSLLRLVGSKRQQHRPRPDEEHATVTGSVVGSSTLGGYSLPPPSHTHHGTHHRAPGDDPLALFRLMLGITEAPHLGFSGRVRPAENVGLYARVVHAEQKAKDSYKVFSAVINACYFLQIIVAAALTSLGAANADNKAITAFGAINTIIAGFLTYLKGSGYPARLKYYANEWKKVREFIEHRERDFSLEGCTLDVYEVVDAVRDMYDATKREIEMNTPDGYNSKTPAAAGPGHPGHPTLNLNAGVDASKAEAIAGKLRGLDETVRKLRGHVGAGIAGAASAAAGLQAKMDEVKTKAEDIKAGAEDAKARAADAHARAEDDVSSRLRSLEDTLHKVRARVERTVHEGQEAVRARVDRAVHEGEQAARVRVDEAAHEGREAAREAALAVQDEKERAAAELRAVGKAVARGVEENRPRPPREISVTLSHRSGDEG